MTETEFDNWLTVHCGYYPDVITWLRKFEATEQHNVMTAWMRELKTVSYDAACKASEMLYHSENQPRSYNLHAREVSVRSEKFTTSAVVFRDNEQQYFCHYCRDDASNTVPVYGFCLPPRRSQIDGKTYPWRPSAAVCIPCRCPKGTARYPNRLCFDPARHVRSTGPFSFDMAALLFLKRVMLAQIDPLQDAEITRERFAACRMHGWLNTKGEVTDNGRSIYSLYEDQV